MVDELFEYYIITTPRRGYKKFDGYGHPIHDVFLTNDKDIAIDEYHKFSKFGNPCRITVPRNGMTDSEIEHSLELRYETCKRKNGILLDIDVTTEWV